MNAADIKKEFLRRKIEAELKKRETSEPLSPHPAAFYGGQRIENIDEMVRGGVVIGPGISTEMIAAERARQGGRQLTMQEVFSLRNIPEPKPDVTEVLKNAGASDPRKFRDRP